VEATRSLDRKRITSQECEEVRTDDAKSVIEVQRGAGLTFVTDGQLNWQDLFRPTVEWCEGLEPGALMRWFDNNTFYRKPEVVGDLAVHDGVGHEFFRSRLVEGSPWKVVLPGPYTFARASEDPGGAAKRAARIGELGGLLKQVARWCADRGAKQVQFSEPWLVYAPVKREELEATAEAFGAITRGLRAETLLQTFFGSLKNVYEPLLDFPVDALGIDLTATNLHDLTDHAFDKGAVLGVVDGRNSLVEVPKDLVDVAEEAVDTLDPDWAAISTSCELDLCPRPVADRKVEVLGRALQLGRERL
jgi:5-methyltetrahydropteroyltriglutamate--homocysteine methyltransferase